MKPRVARCSARRDCMCGGGAEEMQPFLAMANRGRLSSQCLFAKTSDHVTPSIHGREKIIEGGRGGGGDVVGSQPCRDARPVLALTSSSSQGRADGRDAVMKIALPRISQLGR